MYFSFMYVKTVPSTGLCPNDSHSTRLDTSREFGIFETNKPLAGSSWPRGSRSSSWCYLVYGAVCVGAHQPISSATQPDQEKLHFRFRVKALPPACRSRRF